MANRSPVAPARAFTAHVVALVVSLLVTACGSGDSRSGGPEPLPAPSAPVTLSATNGVQVAASALEIAMGGIGSIPMSPIGAVVTTDGAPAPRILSRIASDAHRRVSRASSAATVTGAVQSEPCQVSGSVTLSDSATSASITFNQCSDYEGEVLNGTMAMTGLAQTGDDVNGSLSGTFTVNLTMSDPATTIRFVGGMNFQESWTLTSSSFQMSGSYLGFSDGITTHALSNFEISESVDETTGLVTASSNFTLASTAIDGVVTVATPTAFKTYPFYSPYEGVLLVTGGGGGQVRLTVLGDDAAVSPQVQIEIDADGNGLFEMVLYRDWFELAAG
jgi:hypothetical protein